jgi:hypothetical protein
MRDNNKTPPKTRYGVTTPLWADCGERKKYKRDGDTVGKQRMEQGKCMGQDARQWERKCETTGCNWCEMLNEKRTNVNAVCNGVVGTK